MEVSKAFFGTKCLNIFATGCSTCASPLHNILPFCPIPRLLRARDDKNKFFHCEDSVTSAEIDACESEALLIASFALRQLPSNKVLTS